MSFDLEEGDTNSIYPSEFDEIRLKEAQVGDRIDQEAGNWSVLVYEKSYVLLLNNHKNQNNYLEFQNLSHLLTFLKKN